MTSVGAFRISSTPSRRPRASSCFGAYSWKHFIGGHNGRLGTRDDITLHQLDETARRTAKPVTEKYTGVLAAADVFTEDVAFQVMQSVRLDLGYGSWVHP